MSTGPKQENRGGARPGAGRPPGSKTTLSQAQVSEMLEAAVVRAEKEKKSINELLLDFIYGEDMAKKDRLAAIKLWKDLTMAKMSEGGDTDAALAPVLFLPEKHPRLIGINGGKSE